MLQMKKERMKLGVSQSWIGRVTGIHASTISLIEGGRLKPGVGHMERIAKALEWEGDPAALFKEAGA